MISKYTIVGEGESQGSFQEDGNQHLRLISIEDNLHHKLNNRAKNLLQTQRNNTTENKLQEETS